MIVDRRLLAVGAVVVALVMVGLAALTGGPGAGGHLTGAGSTVDDLSAGQIAVVATSSTTLWPPPASSTPPPPRSSPSTTSSAVASLPADADVEGLVQAGRPVPDPTSVYVDDDGAGHTDDAAPRDAPSEVASAVAVAIWSWRFDDPPDRLARTLSGLASPDVIAAATPPTIELDRRRSVGEVAWAVATPGLPAPALGDSAELVVAVAASQHVTASMSAEVVVERAATLRLQHGPAGWRVVERGGDVIQAAAGHAAVRTGGRVLEEVGPVEPESPPSRRHGGGSRLAKVLPALLALPALLLVGFVAGSPSSDPTCASQPVAVFDGDLARVLATIRTVETGGNYTTTITTSSASGAYAFIDAAWANYGGYSRAWLAPPEVQDAKAAEYATAILQRHHGDVSTVPVTWYLGHLPAPDSGEWDTVPVPSAGNVLTPREYQAKWMAVYNNPTALTAGPDEGVPADEVGPSCVGVIGGPSASPPGVTGLVASQISWGGFVNGEIPYEAMRYSSHSAYMHPGASAAWDQLYAAALAEGFDLRGSGYRPAAAGGHTAGRSNHGWGLAIDVSVLVPGNTYDTEDAAFASDEYVWLQSNGPVYGFINPSFAKPVGLGGTGAGGWRGDQCCFLEPWHWEWTAFLSASTTPPPPAEGASQ